MGINVSGVTSGIAAAGAVADVASSLSGGIAGLQLPADNVLSGYASYDYVISLSALTFADFNFPDTSYKAGKTLPLICKSAGADPDNRISTGFGKHDFFINNLTLDSVIGNNNPKGTNVLTVQFDVYEPYSIGLFMLALQKGADMGGYSNWRQAPFLLGIEFRGMRENGVPLKIPFTTRHIPIHLTTVDIKADERGTRYLVNAVVANAKVLTTEISRLKTDTTVKGKTVQEVLQTGDQSLQAVINRQLDSLKKNGDVGVADRVVILFPKEEDMASAKVAAAAGTAKKTNKAYVNPQLSSGATEVYKKIGVDASSLAQSVSSVNDIGAASMGFDNIRRGDQDAGHENDTWDPVLQIWLRGKMVADSSEGTFKFTQDNDIPTAINQIILSSAYAEKALAADAVEAGTGMRTWWRIDTQIYYLQSQENAPKTNQLPRIAVYKVVPYKVHPSKTAATNTAIAGFKGIEKQVVKRYDYLYTGKNSEVISFDINFSVGFSNALAASPIDNSKDIVTGKANANAADEKKPPSDQQPDGAKDVKGLPAGTQPTQLSNSSTGFFFDNKGGGGSDTATQRIAKAFNDAIRNPVDMINLDLEIMGDPFWLVNSGVGNYVSKPVEGVKDLNKDGSVNWQTSEVDIILNFRTPIDINQYTGMYDFRSPNHQDMTHDAKGGPAIGFTGLYCVNMCTSYFRDGSFRQKLSGFRRSFQEGKKVQPANKSMNVTGEKK